MVGTGACLAISIVFAVGYNDRLKPRTTTNPSRPAQRSGPYELSELHRGHEFANFYDFGEGADSVGSAGYNMYISRDRAIALRLIRVDNVTMPNDDSSNGGSTPFGCIKKVRASPFAWRERHAGMRDSLLWISIIYRRHVASGLLLVDRRR